MSETTLLSLKDRQLDKVLMYVSNVPDFRSCALTCTRLNTLLHDDDVWKYCKGKRTIEEKSNRKRALEQEEWAAPLRQIRLHQIGQHFEDKKDKLNLEWNYILRTLKMRGWRDFVSKILALPCIAYPCSSAGYKLRRPVMIVLAQLVQENMIRFLDCALLLSVHRVKDLPEGSRPSLRLDDIELANRMNLNFKHTPRQWILGYTNPAPALALVEKETRDSIVKALLRVSGIADVENGVVDRLWHEIVGLLKELLYGVTVAKEPPYGKCLNNLDARRVEEVAERIGCQSTRVYGYLNSVDSDTEDDCELCEEDSAVKQRSLLTFLFTAIRTARTRTSRQHTNGTGNPTQMKYMFIFNLLKIGGVRNGVSRFLLCLYLCVRLSIDLGFFYTNLSVLCPHP